MISIRGARKLVRTTVLTYSWSQLRISKAVWMVLGELELRFAVSCVYFLWSSKYPLLDVIIFFLRVVGVHMIDHGIGVNLVETLIN